MNTVEVVGLAEMLNKLRKFVTNFDAKAEMVLNDQANEVLYESRNQAPFDTGTLVKQSSVENTGKLERTIIYRTPYAERLHEHPEYNFQNGRKGKYLEDPIKKFAGQGLRILQKNLIVDNSFVK